MRCRCHIKKHNYLQDNAFQHHHNCHLHRTRRRNRRIEGFGQRHLKDSFVDIQTIEKYIKIGLQYIIIGTAAVKNPEFLKEACREFPNHIIVGIDAKNGQVATDGWAEVSNISAVDLGKKFEDVE